MYMRGRLFIKIRCIWIADFWLLILCLIMTRPSGCKGQSCPLKECSGKEEKNESVLWERYKCLMASKVQSRPLGKLEHSGENRKQCFFILSRSCGPVPSRQDNSDSCLLSITLICHALNIFVKSRQAQMHSDSVLHNQSTMANQLCF